jgi:hypothetical protein
LKPGCGCVNDLNLVPGTAEARTGLSMGEQLQPMAGM